MKTKVIFRKEHPERGGEIIAVFPGIMGNPDPYLTCSYYSHVGQHGAMDIYHFYQTLPASPDEYQTLRVELESLGYDLQIAKRMSYKDVQARIKQTEPIRNAK